MDTDTATINPPRAPQQGRSKASFERMLATAEQLMAERGNDDFTLSEVAKRGSVSIGSIYCRFDSKDDLIHAVQHRVLERVDAEMLVEIEAARKGADTLEALLRDLVECTAESLRRFADVMRPFMLRASNDPVVASIGKQSYARTADAVQGAILEHRGAIRHPDPPHAADAAFRMLYASLARYLGFGSSIDAAGEGNWNELKRDLGDMVSAYLITVPVAGQSPRKR